MRIASRTAQQRSSAAAMKEGRAQDAAHAMRDYETKRVATLAKTTRLRALRLAKEAEAGNSAPRKTRSRKKAD